MKNIPIDTLRSFATIVDLGSFTLAGDTLYKSQSSMSLQIKKLESLIGHTLFDRNGHNFELTPAGACLLRYARQILHLNDCAVGELLDNGVRGTVRLGIPSEFAGRLLPKIVGNFSRQYPHITLEVECDLSCNLKKGLNKKKYDLALSILDAPDEAQNQYMIEDELVWVATKECYLEESRPLRLVFAPDGCIYRARALKRLQEANIPWTITYTIMDIGGITSAVEEGLGLTVIAKKTIPNSLQQILPPNGTQPLGCIGLTLLQTTSKLSDAGECLANYIKQQL